MREVQLILIVILVVLVIWILCRRTKCRKEKQSVCKSDNDCAQGETCNAGRCVVDLPYVPPPPSPDCGPPKPDAPLVTKYAGSGVSTCPVAEFIDVNTTDQNIPGAVYIFTGTGQLGDVDNYMTFNSTPSYVGNIVLKCSASASQHRTAYITSVMGTSGVSPLPAVSGTSANVSWDATEGADEYAVVVYGQYDGRNLFYGGFTSQTSISIPVQAGIPNQYAIVLGYKKCDKSALSNATSYTTTQP